MKCKFCDNEPVGTCQQCGGSHCDRHGKKFLTKVFCKRCYKFVYVATFLLVNFTVWIVIGCVLLTAKR